MPLRNALLAGATALLLAAPAAAEGPSVRAAPDPAQAALDRVLAIEGQLVETLAKVRQSSVSVLVKKIPTVKEGEPPADAVVVGCGSGVVISRNGKSWVITNYHVADAGDVLAVVTLDGEERPVVLVDTVAQYDIALLGFVDREIGLKPVPVRPEAGRDLAEGQWVLATGNPFFLATDGRSVSTLGVVSGLGRVLDGNFLYGSAIQHDAEVNPGNSGGPLWNLKGELVGINGMIATRPLAPGCGPCNTGASFSIPIHQVEPYLKALIDAKKDAQAGFLGIACVTETDGKGAPVGARVVRVELRSPAFTPQPNGDGLCEGDLVQSLSVVGKKTYRIRTDSELKNALVLLPAGTPVRIGFRRSGKAESWSGKLGTPK